MPKPNAPKPPSLLEKWRVIPARTRRRVVALCWVVVAVVALTLIGFWAANISSFGVSAQQVSNVTSVLQAIGLIGSLVFVSIQITAAARATESSAYQAIIQSWAAIDAQISRDDALTRIYLEGRKSRVGLQEGIERERFDSFISSYLNQYEHLFVCYEQGVISHDLFSGWCRNLAEDMTKDGVQDYWCEKGKYFCGAFRDFVDNERYKAIMRTDSTPSPLEQLRAEVKRLKTENADLRKQVGGYEAARGTEATPTEQG
jgi:hypothetical protein